MRSIWTAAKRKVSSACVVPTTSSRDFLFDPYNSFVLFVSIFCFFLFLAFYSPLKIWAERRPELFEWALVDEIRWNENLTCVMKMTIWFFVSHSRNVVFCFCFFKCTDFLSVFIFNALRSVALQVGIILLHSLCFHS